MGTQYQSGSMLSVEEALEQVLMLSPVLEAQQVDMLEARGRVLAQDIASDIDISPFDNSAMDGFALKAEDTEGASETAPVKLTIVGEIGAGEVYNDTLMSGQALRIMTGAPVPAGATTVVKIEDVEVLDESSQHPEGTTLVVKTPIKLDKNIRRKGEETLAGQVLLSKGTTLHAAGIGLLAATGNPTPLVYLRPRVAILSSGDELIGPEEKPGPGQIRNSNCYALASAVEEAGGKPTILGIVRDDEDAIRTALKSAASAYDMVLISGGAAEGDYDYTFKVINELGTVHFSKVRMRPGKAQTLGQIDNTIVFGLPGNPAAAMVGFEILLRPALRKMQGFKKLQRPQTSARLMQSAKKPDARRFYIRARLERSKEDNEFIVTPSNNQSSALLTSYQEANCLVVLPEGSEGSSEGSMVSCLRLDIAEGVVL